MWTTYITILLCLVVGVVVSFPGGKGGRPGKDGRPGKEGRPEQYGRPGKDGRPGPDGRPHRGRRLHIGEVTEAQSEKSFFCHIAHRACHLVEDGEDPLVDRTCPGNAACDGSSGTTSLNGTDYTITFCAKPDKENLEEDEGKQRKLKKEKPEPNEALQEICKPDRKENKERPNKPDRKPRWFYRACKVNNDNEDIYTRDCKEESTCSKGPYEAEVDGEEVEVTFCERPEAEEEEDEEKMAYWYKAACLVTEGDDTVKERKCPNDLECITRLTDMDYEGNKVDAGYCGGFCFRHRRGRKGKHGKNRHDSKGKWAKGGKGKAGKSGMRRQEDPKGKGAKGEERNERRKGPGKRKGGKGRAGK